MYIQLVKLNLREGIMCIQIVMLYLRDEIM